MAGGVECVEGDFLGLPYAPYAARMAMAAAPSRIADDTNTLLNDSNFALRASRVRPACTLWFCQASELWRHHMPAQ